MAGTVGTDIAGTRATDLVSASLIKRSVYEAIFDFMPYQTPIAQFYFASKRNKLAVGNPKFEIQEDILVQPSTTVATVTGGTTDTWTVTTPTGLYFKVGDVVRISTTNENARITSAAATSLGVSGISGASITATSNATIIRVGAAYGEGTASAAAVSTIASFPYNYTQILKEAVHMTGTQLATVNYGGSDWVHQRVKATEQFKIQIEKMSIYGIRGVDTTAGANVRYSAGFLDTTSLAMGIADYSQYAGGSDGTDFCDEDYFFKTYCKNLFAKGSNEKVLYCGSEALLGINDFSKVKQQTKVGEKEYGVDIQVILTPFGRARLVWHPMLDNVWSNWVIGVDRDQYLKYAYLAGNGINRDVQYQTNIGTVGTDERKEQYLAEIGMWLAGGGQGIHRTLKSGG